MKRHLAPFVALFAIALLAISPAHAQKKEKPTAKTPAAKSAEAKPAPKPAPPPLTEDSIKPLPEEPIPDNPPPHEGALFKFPHQIESPDLIIVEVLEALPGRPITGEHLVRPDGKIGLGFYGEVHVAGLTTTQAKAKIILHLRTHLVDQALGLVIYDVTGGTPIESLKLPGTILDPSGYTVPAVYAVGEAERPKQEPEKPRTRSDKSKKEQGKDKAAEDVNREEKEGREVPPSPEQKKIEKEPAKNAAHSTGPGIPKPAFIAIAPEESATVFVDVAAYNSKFYYALGYFGTPGRMSYTGNDTVLDAVQHVGGFSGTPNPRVWLHRPARGGKPKRDIKIDMVAIYRGDKTSNLQLFPGDRLVAYGKGEEPEIEKKAK